MNRQPLMRATGVAGHWRRGGPAGGAPAAGRIVWLATAALSFLAGLGCPPPPASVPEPILVTPILPPEDTAASPPSSLVGMVEILPGELFITPSSPPPGSPTRVELSVRVWGPDGTIVPESDGLIPVWTTSDSFVEVISFTGYRAVLEVSEFPPLLYHVSVTAVVDGVPSANAALLKIDGDTAMNPSDRVVAQHSQASPANVALIDGLLDQDGSTACVNDRLTAFASVGLPGKFLWGCESDSADVAVLSHDNALIYSPAVRWTPAMDMQDFSASPARIREVPLKVWIGVHDGFASESSLLVLKNEWRAKADAEVALANEILRRARAGIKLTVLGGVAQFTDGMEFHYYTCYDQLGDRQDGVLNIYYVNRTSPGRAHYCARQDKVPDRNEDVIHISTEHHSSTSFVHEVGHALGLVMPRAGHTNELTSFRGDNVMWGHGDDTHRANLRNQFSLGQAFRLTVDAFSWINHSPAVVLDGDGLPAAATDGSLARDAAEVRLPCQCSTGAAQPCPALALDLLPVGGGTESRPEECSDWITVVNASSALDAVGLMHAREWRLPDGSCAWVSGVRQDGIDDLRLLFPNLVKDPSCRPELAVFLPANAMVSHTIDMEYVDYLHTNSVEVEATLQPPWEIPVSLWHEGGLDGYDPAEEIARADQVFGGLLDGGRSNRTGLRIKWARPQQDEGWTESTPEFQSVVGTVKAGCQAAVVGNRYVSTGSVNVYFLTAATASAAEWAFLETDRGTSCADGGTYFIVLAPSLPYSPTSFAHHLGHALGLDHVSGADDLAWDNVMWSAPYPSGLEARSDLTLGQVYRMNVLPTSWLNLSVLSGRKGQSTVTCGGASGDCPAVGARVGTP